MIVALTQSPDRLREYAADERHAAFVADVPSADLVVMVTSAGFDAPGAGRGRSGNPGPQRY